MDDYSFEKAYSNCRLCPRRCGVNRLDRGDGAGGIAGDFGGYNDGFCRESSRLRIASASLHNGEEPPVSGSGGSGTVFISGCNLGCLFCQNWDISIGGAGYAVSEAELVNTFLVLERTGAENINLVTPTHAAPFLARCIVAARDRGLSLPVLWNSSAYETVETLGMMEGLVDIWMPDLKTLDSTVAFDYFKAADYPAYAERAILYMLEGSQLTYSREGTILSGVIIRHLVLPGHLEASRRVLEWFARHAKGRAVLSLLTQYSPPRRAARNAAGIDLPRGRVSREDEVTLAQWLEELKIEDGFFQGRPLSSVRPSDLARRLGRFFCF
ncbi:MAG: radical SAM protein [Spirochaetes bacterium]|nr:radical SAM protein [Spirochaetota bacterium]